MDKSWLVLLIVGGVLCLAFTFLLVASQRYSEKQGWEQEKKRAKVWDISMKKQ